MNNYWCQNVCIKSTASDRILDTLEIPPHNSSTPQISSTYRLLISDQYTTDTLKRPHPDVPSATIKYDNTTALTTLAAIFTKKLHNPPVQAKTTASKDAESKQPAAMGEQVLTSPVNKKNRTILQTRNNQTDPANVIDYQNSPQPMRMVIPETRDASPLRVPKRERNLSPRNLSYEYFLNMGISN